MANGIDITTTSNPWKIAFHLGAGTALPATIVGKQNTGNVAFPVIAQRIVWISESAAAGDEVIGQDINGNDIFRFVASGADFEPPQEWKRATKEGYVQGLVITQMDSGELYIYI